MNQKDHHPSEVRYVPLPHPEEVERWLRLAYELGLSEGYEAARENKEAAGDERPVPHSGGLPAEGDRGTALPVPLEALCGVSEEGLWLKNFTSRHTRSTCRDSVTYGAHQN